MGAKAGDRTRKPPDLPDILGGRYRVLGEIGRGGMGRVLRVEHLHTGEILAMKLLLGSHSDPARVERFRREARSLAQVRGEHVVRVIDADVAAEFDNSPYLVMELLDGEDLSAYLKRRGKLDAAEVSGLLFQMAQGLARVHRAGLIHRDLKPGNIFLCRGENGVSVKLLDFGLVKTALGAGEGEITVSLEGQIVGTPLYMSPEQLRGASDEVGPPTDIWAVGMLTYYLLTGRHYWETKRVPRWILDIGAGPPEPPSKSEPSLTAAFDGWFLRSCALSPSARWPDALTQARQLAVALGFPAPELPPIVLKESDTAPATVTLHRRAGESGSATLAPRQRRQVAVLFYRLEHTARAAPEMDPEDFEALEMRLHSALDEAFGDLARGSTHFAQGGRFVFFGYPVAYGQDARRAVEAALRLVALARGLNEALAREGAGGLEVRVGIHSGVVLSGSGVAEIRGAALGIATDLEHCAARGQILVSPAAWQMLEGHFRGETLQDGNFAVLGAMEDTESGSAGGVMVGRDLELNMLLSRLEEARAGETQMALISGEAGIGKSRLLQALRESPGAAGVAWAECGCSPYFQASAFHPLIELVHTLTRGPAGEEAGGGEAGAEPGKILQFLAGGGDESEAQRLSPTLRRERAIAALISLLHRRAEKRPLIFVVEDLHWADPSTLEFLDRFSMLRNAPVLALMTARLEFTPFSTSPGAIAPLQLRPLSRAQSAQLILHAAKVQLPADVLDKVSRTAHGIPLFIEELARLAAQGLAMQGSAAQGSAVGSGAGRVPATLREALIARLDRLGPARLLAEQAAVIGNVFSLEDLRIVAQVGEVEGGVEAWLEANIRELVRAKVFQPRGLPPHDSYAFQHALLRDVAYELAPREARRELHARLALAMAARPSAEPEVLAHHFAEGGMFLKAAGAFLSAGQAALARSANAEARDYFERGIDALKHAKPAVPEQAAAKASLEITLYTMKGMGWVVSRGYAVPEAEAAFAAAMEGVRALHREETPDLAPALWAQWIFTLVRGRFGDAERQGRHLLGLARRWGGDSGVTMLGHLAIGCALVGEGRFEESVRHLCEALALYDAEAHAAYRFMYGQDPWMFGGVFKAWSLWCLGFPDQAARAVSDAVAHAEGLRHPNSLGFALALSALIHHYRGEVDEVERASKSLTDLSLEQGWIHWLAHARLWSGAAQVMRGRVEEGVESMRAAREFAEQAGERSGATHYDAVFVDALVRAGRLDEAAERAAVAKRKMHEAGELGFEPDLLCAEGEIARARGDAAAARTLFEQALESATARRNLSYRLRAALAIASLETGGVVDREQASRRLRAIRAEFTEGFATADLRAAQALENNIGGTT